MPYCIYSKDKKPLQIYDFYEDAASAVLDIEGAYMVEITDEEAEYIENDISDYKYFKNNYGEDEDDLDFERSWGPDDDEEGPDYNEAHAKEWMEKHPHGYYNNEEDYGYEDGKETINVKEDINPETGFDENSKYEVRSCFYDENREPEYHEFENFDDAVEEVKKQLAKTDEVDEVVLWDIEEEDAIFGINSKEKFMTAPCGPGANGDIWYIGYNEADACNFVDQAYPDWTRYGLGGDDTFPYALKLTLNATLNELQLFDDIARELENVDINNKDAYYKAMDSVLNKYNDEIRDLKLFDENSGSWEIIYDADELRNNAEDESNYTIYVKYKNNEEEYFDFDDLDEAKATMDTLRKNNNVEFANLKDNYEEEIIDSINESLKEYYNQEDDYPKETFTPEEQEEYGIDEEGIDESGEQWIHCEWCEDVVPISDCRRELNLGWICDRCQDALWSRGEKAAYYEAKDIKKFTKAEKELKEGIIFSDKAIRCQVKDLLNDPLGKLILSRLQAGRLGNGPYRLSDEELEILKDEYIYYEDDGDCYYARFEKPTNEIRKILNLSPQSDNPFIADKESYTEDLDKNKLPKVGDTIRIIHLKDEDNRYDGRVGEVESIDDIGQLHGTWGGLAVIPEEDEFEIVTAANESLEESNQLNEDARYVGDYRGFSIYKEVGGGYWAQKGYSDDVFDEEFESKADIKKAIDDLINSSGRRGLCDRFGESLTEDTDDDWADLDDWVDFP